MKFHFCTFFLLALLFVAINAVLELDEACTDVDDNPGICISLKQCPKLLNLVKESQKSILDHLAVIKILQRSNCGYAKQDPYVCCSQANPDVLGSPLQGNTQPPQSSKVTYATSGFSNTTILTPTFSDAPASSPAPNVTETKTTEVLNLTTPVPTTAESSSTEDTFTEETNGNSETHDIMEKLKMLPEDCGRVLTFKFFYGNRTDIDDFPWTTLIEYDTPSGRRFACGGALISDRYVLTAAHCVSGLQPSWKVTGVRLGEYDISTNIDCLPDGVFDVDCAEEPLNVGVEKIFVHLEFDPKNQNRPHDIALLKLAEKVSFTDFIKPICLPLVQPIPQRYYTSGWGKKIERNGTELKYMSYLTLDNSKFCSEKYKHEKISISPHQVCAGIQSTEKSCIGDEGGPLMGIEERSDYMKRVATFGVLSMTYPSDRACKEYGRPGVYTKVLDYLPWILNQLEE